MEVSGRTKSKHKQAKGNILCQPCHSDGDNLPADGYCETCNEYFCSSCLKFHRKQSMSRNHVIKNKHEMPRVHILMDSSSQLCDVHKTEVIRFYCQGHNSVGCGDCMVLKHKSCDVQLVSDVSSNYGNSDDLLRIKKKLLHLQEKISTSKDEIKRSLTVAQEVKIKIQDEIKAFRREMNSYLNSVEAELVNEVEQLSAQDISHQRVLLDECESMKIELHAYQKKLDQYSEKVNDLFVTAKRAQTKLLSCKENIEEIASNNQINVYKLATCKDMNTLIKKRIPIGTIKTDMQKIRVENKMADLKATFVKKVSVTVPNESGCFITGLTMLSEEEIVLADGNMESLKIFHITRNAITSKYKLPVQPWDVTLVNFETVATTLPGPGKILFLSTKNGLSEKHSLNVRKGCKGIDHHNGVIAVSFVDPPAVQILNMKGNILHMVKKTNILSEPNYIAFRDANSIFVSDFGEEAIYDFTKDGHLKATLDLQHPGGLTVTSNGTVVVCSLADDDVKMILPKTNAIQSLIDMNKQMPWLVAVCEENDTLYICMHVCSEHGDAMQIYDLK